MARIDPHSETWAAVKAMLILGIEKATHELIQPGCDPRRADEMRGRIAQAGEILNSVKAPKSAPPILQSREYV